jgi:hypothetical protein
MASIAVAFVQNMTDIILLLHCLSISCYDINHVLPEIWVHKATQIEARISTNYTVHQQFRHKQTTLYTLNYKGI